MQKTSVLPYIWSGTAIRYLRHAEVGYRIHGDAKIIYNIERLMENLAAANLRVSQQAVTTSGLRGLLDELKEKADSATLSNEDAKRLNDNIEEVYRVITAEAMQSYVYLVTDKRLTVDKILDSVESLFHPDCFSKLSDIAQYDFRQAGRCIAFELPTAAAFHLLRGTEAVLRDYYEEIVQRSRIKSRLWGPLIDHLRLKRGHDIALLANLDNIRLSYRNPTQHPEKIYDIHEVQDLFGLCVDVVNRMAKRFEGSH